MLVVKLVNSLHIERIPYNVRPSETIKAKKVTVFSAAVRVCRKYLIKLNAPASAPIPLRYWLRLLLSRQKILRFCYKPCILSR